MIKLSLKLSPDIGEDRLQDECARQLGISVSDIEYMKISGRSLDARRGRPPFFLWNIVLSVPGKEGQLISKKLCEEYEPKPPYMLPSASRTKTKRPVVVGFGPSGIFCALILAQKGYDPIIIERGQSVEKRVADVNNFFSNRVLKTESNIQFGEGGAGTFSDGKLGTLISDPAGRIGFVLNTFASFGAGDEIRYVSKPHIGTDVLRDVVKNIRNYIIRLGGEFRFGTRMTDIISENGSIVGIMCGDEFIETDAVFLGIGHSARDTFEMLCKRGVMMEKKPFSVGVRIEHLQSDIDRAMYHGYQKKFRLPAADYKLSYHTKSGRGVYTFCMCPGGVVVPACSEEGGMVTNGMSFRARDKRNANSAVLVGINPEDVFGDLFAGMRLQRELERKAFILGGENYSAPAQTVGDFLRGKPSTGFGMVKPSCPTGATPCDLHRLLPKAVSASIAEALPEFGKKIQGFAGEEAVMTGVESRSTCPIRIIRNPETMQASIRGLYPMGEGAGYAGGITSAAVDGMKSAEKYIENA